MNSRIWQGSMSLVFAVFAFGCTVGPNHVAPSRDLPEVWREGGDGITAASPSELARWWQQLGDPVLDGLVARAFADGLELREALARLQESRALRGVAAADRGPTLEANAALTRLGDSESTPFGPFATDWTRYAGSLDASWELDLWGRVSRSIEVADAELDAAVADVHAALVSVAAEIALSYVELRSAQQRLAIARANVDLQEQTVELVRGRLDAGLVGERDVAQANTNVESTRARVPALVAAVRLAENRLAVLVGAPPGALQAELAADLGAVRPVPVPPAEIAVGVPADLLRRRPDVRRAERRLAAETARIGVAEAELYPELRLGGSLGIVADDSSRVFEAASGAFSFGPSLRWSLFDGGRTRRRIAAQEARAAQALVQWERAVLTAVEESENAMTALVQEQLRQRALTAAASAARASVELAKTQYREGLSDFQAVLDSERVLAELEDSLALSGATVTTNLVALFKALGGGWPESWGPGEPGAQERAGG